MTEGFLKADLARDQEFYPAVYDARLWIGCVVLRVIHAPAPSLGILP